MVFSVVVLVTVCISVVALVAAGVPDVSRSSHLTKPIADLTAADLIARSDNQLNGFDPLIVNLVVAREIPGLESLDIGRYTRTVDGWAEQIRRGQRAQEPQARLTEAAYWQDPDLWRASSMAMALAGPSIGITYTSGTLDPGDPAQTFVHGLIDTKRGTCASMPVLYLAVAHRLGWPLRGVVSKDHFWCRWDDGKPGAKGGKRFNLEATCATSDGSVGSFASLSDEEYAAWLGTSPLAISSGSDLALLTPR